MKKWTSLLAIASLVSVQAFAKGGDRQLKNLPKSEVSPWFTGPLLTPSPFTVPAGHVNIEPYEFYFNNYGVYDRHWDDHRKTSLITWNTQVLMQFGIAKGLEFDIAPQVVTNSISGINSTFMGDLPITLSYQLFDGKSETLMPAIKIGFKENIPFGNYDRFNPAKAAVQSTGSGSFVTTFFVNLGRTYNLYRNHFLNFRTSLSYSIPTDVHVEGFNSYGGGNGTYGTLKPGNAFSWFTGVEYSLTQNWVLSCDLAFVATSKSTFKGNLGTVPDASLISSVSFGNPSLNGAPQATFDGGDSIASMGSSSSRQWSLAPALEYDFNEHIGIIAGPYFTFAGKNAPAFTSGVAAINIYY
jgi:hypothetical protein